MTIQQKTFEKIFVKTHNYRRYEKFRVPFVLKTKNTMHHHFRNCGKPVENIFIGMPLLEARGDKPLQMNFEHQLKSFVFYHLSREVIAPPAGIKKSNFFEVINSRGLKQLTYIFQELQAKAVKILPSEYAGRGNLVAIDGSFIDAVLSMDWADYRNDCRKAKLHLGFDINQSISSKVFSIDGEADEHPFVNQTEKEPRVVVYRIGNKVNWIATYRYDLSAEEIVTVYKLRWNIEIFFGWWKCHLKVYHLISRSKRGLMAQILGGLITYLLLAIYCREHYQEKVCIKEVRELRIKIQNEARNLENNIPNPTCQQTGLDNLKKQQ